MWPNNPIIWSDALGQQLLEGGLKILFVVFFALYAIFAGLVVRQVKLMSHTISSPADGVIGLASWLYFGLAAAVLLLAVFTL